MPTINRRVLSNLIELIKPYISESVVSLDNWRIRRGKYDGEGKFHTTIGDYAFIGCNTNLVAPVTIGDHAFTAAGSTIGHDVPAGALGIERAKQAEIDGWGERKLEKYIAKKQKLEAEKKGK